jgi:mono/diheme cytochrome c family protein
MRHPIKTPLYALIASSFATAILCVAFTAPAKAAAPAGAKNEEAVHAGQQVFTQRCFGCHSVIEGQQRFGPSLFGELKSPHPKRTPAEIRQILQNGQKGKIGTMPPFKDILTKEDTDNLMAYLRTL